MLLSIRLGLFASLRNGPGKVGAMRLSCCMINSLCLPVCCAIRIVEHCRLTQANSSAMDVVTSVSLPDETHPETRSSCTADSFLTGGSIGKPAPGDGEVDSRLRTYTLMHVEGQSFDAQHSQLYASDVSWARQDVNMPMVSMQDYAPDRTGDSGLWEDEQLTSYRGTGNPVTLSLLSRHLPRATCKLLENIARWVTPCTTSCPPTHTGFRTVTQPPHARYQETRTPGSTP